MKLEKGHSMLSSLRAPISLSPISLQSLSGLSPSLSLLSLGTKKKLRRLTPLFSPFFVHEQMAHKFEAQGSKVVVWDVNKAGLEQLGAC